MRAKSHAELERIRKGVERVKTLSDRVIGIGPFGIGMDGALAWIPGAGAAYSFLAGGYLLMQAWRAHASVGALAKMTAILAVDTLIDVPPGGPASLVVDTLFTGHKWSANLLKRQMDRTHYVEATADEAAEDQGHTQAIAAARREGKRVVFLG